VVPGRGTTIYTVNFAHRRAAWTLILGTFIGFSVVTVLPIVLDARPLVLFLCIGAGLLAVIGIHAWLLRAYDE